VGPGGAIYFAPLVRDELRRYDRGGRLQWTTRRGLYKEEADPHFLPARGREIPVARALVNIALALGPDGRLYALGSADSNATRLRLDAFDTATGALVLTRTLAAGETAIAVDARGTILAQDADSLLARAPATGRETFAPAFALANLAGDTVRLADFAGKVTLVNFWASWCDPCRAEFPHMAELYGAFGRADFAIVGISDDVDRGKMMAFVRQFGPPFPILVGGGAMKGTYHYRGLPYSVLLDRRGRVVERIFGFGGVPEFRSLRLTIAKEVAAP
jgi:thiol-disulfide isomerase/thioredoxin